MISRWNPTCSTSLLPCLWHNVGKEIVYSVAIIILLTKVGTVCHLHLNSFVPCIKNLTVTASCVFLFCSFHFYQYVKHVLKLSLYSLLQPTKLDLLVQIMPLKYWHCDTDLLLPVCYCLLLIVRTYHANEFGMMSHWCDSQGGEEHAHEEIEVYVRTETVVILPGLR